MTNDISRRTLAQGAAWAVPAIAVAGAAPAFAASLKPVLTSSTTQAKADQRGDSVPHWNCSARTTQVEIYNTRASGNITITNAPTGATLTNLKMEFWVAVDSNTTWTIATTATTGTSSTYNTVGGSTCWSAPVRSYHDEVYNGITHYSYTTTFTCTLAKTTGSTWTLPLNQKFDFLSSCQSVWNLKDPYVKYTQWIDVNGSTLTKTALWTKMA